MSLENRVQMNTSGIRDESMKMKGAQTYFNELEGAWYTYIQSAIVNDLRVELGNGIAGHDGFEGGWTKLCSGNLSSDVALAYRIDF